jgi:hypothetical protein
MCVHSNPVLSDNAEPVVYEGDMLTKERWTYLQTSNIFDIKVLSFNQSRCPVTLDAGGLPSFPKSATAEQFCCDILVGCRDLVLEYLMTFLVHLLGR